MLSIVCSIRNICLAITMITRAISSGWRASEEVLRSGLADVALLHGFCVRRAAIDSQERSQSEELARRHNSGRHLLAVEGQVV